MGGSVGMERRVVLKQSLGASRSLYMDKGKCQGDQSLTLNTHVMRMTVIRDEGWASSLGEKVTFLCVMSHWEEPPRHPGNRFEVGTTGVWVGF